MPKIAAILDIADEHIADSIAESIGARGSFTNVVNADPAKIASKGLTLLYLNIGYATGSNCFICILKKQSRVATGQARVKATRCIPIEAFDLDELIGGLPNLQFQRRAAAAFGHGYQRLSNKLSVHVFDTLKKQYPADAEVLDELYHQLKHQVIRKPSARQEDAAVEQDAVGLSLDIFGANRSEIFRSWDRQRSDLGTSFLKGLPKYAAYEDDIIHYDVNHFPGFEAVSGDDITGVVEFENGEGEQLTVINANRKPLEKALGVDLIYFDRKQAAFVMVQYKLMDQRSEENDDLYFNPGQGNHDEELQRLSELRQLIAAEDLPDGLSGYRFADCPLFFKLCRKIQPRIDDHSLAPGMYIPLDQWLLLLDDDSTLGRNGGRQLGYHTLQKRYLNKETFVGLIRSGLIGTAGNASEKIGTFIEAAIAMGHSVLYAVEERSAKRAGRRSLSEELGLDDEAEDDIPW